LKALTICQPYAHLICLPESDPWHKRIENRKRPFSYRGPLAIHAGISRKFMSDGDLERWPDMVFGAVVAIVTLHTCFSFSRSPTQRLPIVDRWIEVMYPWVLTHQHTEGPYCLMLRAVTPLETPIPWRGQQGLFEIPDDVCKGAA
jgi:hypothetical protein